MSIRSSHGPFGLVLLFVFVALPALASAQGTRLLRDPDVGPQHIAFTYANDLWLAPRGGGDAVRLTSGEGAETDAAFSPDGQWIAFTAHYAGDTDVYVVPAGGGQPTRLTWHTANDVVQGWTPDGRVLFQSNRESQPTRLWKFFTVGPEGGMPEALAVPQAYDGEMSADGTMLAYQEIGLWDPGWRNYRGGQAQPIAVVSLDEYERRTTPWEGERHLEPVWLDGVVYYLSERDWASNVWSWDPATGEEEQMTFHADFDVMSLGSGFGSVVYEQGGYLHELDPATGESTQLVIEVAGDLNWARPRWVDVGATQLDNGRLSPTGQRAVFEHRGDIFTVPADAGSWRNLTRSPGVADRSPVWSPDGSQIAWFNDEGGEYGLVVADQFGENRRRVALADPTFYFIPTWSPDGSRLAFTDTDYRVLVMDVASGEVTHVDTDRYAHPERSMNPVWSPDSRWIAYARRLDNHLRAVFVHDTETGTTSQLTDGMADAISPVWGEDGEHMYFLAWTDYGLNTGWLDMTSYDRPVTRSLYVALLANDEASPFMPKSDEEGSAGVDDEDDDAEHEDADADEGDDDDEGVEIDLDGIADRILAAPGLPARNYVALGRAPSGHVFVVESVPNQGTVLKRYSLEDREATDWVEGVAEFEVSHDRKKLLVRVGSVWSIVGTGSAPRAGEGRLEVGDIRILAEPRAEYRQMLRDGWRFMRDFLYVDNLHGAPWDDVWQWYEPWLDDIYHRSDFNHVLDMLSGEIAVGHSYVAGGDYPDIDSPRGGLLGADLEAADGRYRITRLYDGEDWTPGLRGPLTHPGMDIEVGDYILAIDGRDLAVPDNPYRLLEGTAGRTIQITVASDASGSDSRNVWVEPTGSENGLRTWAWVAENQRRVDEMSGGRLAYVWLPNTGNGGYSYFNRMYFAQQDRQGAVIDERNNGGGSAADYIVEVLDRELTGYFNSRAGDHRPFTQPIAGLWGPKVMVINERAGSGGDLLPYLFRFKEVGPLVGTRTWGGLVGTWDTPPLIDGGRFVAPRGGFYDVNGEWAVEATGVAPDIEVRNDPAEVIAGGDPQLEAAVREALRLLAEQPFTLMPEPEPPVRWRRPERFQQQGGGSGGEGGEAGSGASSGSGTSSGAHGSSGSGGS